MSTNRDNGGAAFPSPGVVLKSKFDGDPYQQGAYEGMTLRDYFAAKAMAAWLSTVGIHPAWCDEEGLSELAMAHANSAYGLADAMLKARAA